MGWEERGVLLSLEKSRKWVTRPRRKSGRQAGGRAHALRNSYGVGSGSEAGE